MITGDSRFSNPGNWQGNELPSWGYGNSLKFNQNQNPDVIRLSYNWGEWRQVNDIFWDSSFPVDRTLSSNQINGGGINFKTRIENNSSFTQTVDLNLSGGSDGASDIQLNPVKGSLTLSGTIFNDNSVDYTVYGSDTGTTTNLTLNTALGPNATQANVDFTVAGGRNTAVQVNASQLWAGTTTVNSGAFTTGNGVTLASTAIVVGGGTVATTSANTLADAASLTVNTGRLAIGGSDTVASLAGSGGTVNIASGATLTAGNASSTSYAGSITGSGGFTKVGSGTFTLSAASSMTGTTTVSAGQFSLGGSNLLADTSAVAVAGGVLALGGNSDTVGSFAISGGSLTGSGTVTAANYTLGGGTVAANLGSGAVNVTGNASLNGTSNGTTLNLTSGTVTLGSAGRLAATTAVAVTGSAGGALALGGSETIGSLAGAANVTLGSSALTVGGNNQSTTYSGGLSGSGLFTKVGSGTLTLSGVNYNSGGTTVSAGRLVGTTSSLQGAITNNAAVTFDQATSGTYSGAMTGSGSLTKIGDSVVTLSGNNSTSGGVAINAGSLALGSVNALGTTGTISFGGGALRYSASNTTDYSGRFSTASSQQYRIDTNGQSVTLGSDLTSVGGTLTKIGSGTLTLTGANSYDGGTTVSGGRLVAVGPFSIQTAVLNNAELEFVSTVGNYNFDKEISGSGALIKSGAGGLFLVGTSSYSGGTVINEGTLIGDTSSLQGAIANGGVVSIGMDGAGTFAGAISGTGALEVLGGNITFTGTSTYTGATTVFGGSLAVNGALGNTAVTVQGGGILGGSGAVGGSVLVDGVGILSPGNSIASLAVGATTFTGTSEFLGASTFEYEVDSTNPGALGTAADLLVINGGLNLDLNDSTILTFTDLASTPQAFVDDTTIFALINYAGAWNGGLFTYSGSVLADGDRFTVGSQEWEIDYNRTSFAGLDNFTSDYLPSSSFVAITAVPEPSTLVLLGIAAAILAVRRRAAR